MAGTSRGFYSLLPASLHKAFPKVLVPISGLVALLFWLMIPAWAGVGGSISGTVTDASSAVILKAVVTVTGTDTGIRRSVTTDNKGFYSLTSLPVGHYNVEIEATSFRPYRRAGVAIDANSALTMDAVLELGQISDTVTVVDDQLHIDTASTQMGEVISGTQMTAVPLNGRSFTDLLALQPGVAPITTMTSDTVQDVGASALSPSGDLNPGTISINGQREFANAFIVNGSDAEEDVNMGAAIVPNLDSISEFRILTNNFDAEYGEFSGGQIKTSLAGPWAGRFARIRFSSLPIIRAPGRRKESTPAKFPCPRCKTAPVTYPMWQAHS